MQQNLLGLEERLKARSGLLLPGEMENVVGGHRVPLTQGLFAIVDLEDYDLVSEFKWYAARLGKRKLPYAVRGDYSHGRSKRKAVFLHQFILQAKRADHINGDTLDNRRNNLRSSTHQQNCFNKHFTTKSSSNQSRFKGVCWHVRLNKWQASIGIDYKKISLGYFTLEEDAAKAYNDAALRYHGSFASLNCLDNSKAISPLDRL